MMQGQQLIGASALVGRTVTYQDANGVSQTGVVTKTKLNGDSEPTLVVGNMDVQLSKVTEVQQSPASTGTTGGPAAGSGPTATQPTTSDSATTKDN